jgi:hypothetical protein
MLPHDLKGAARATLGHAHIADAEGDGIGAVDEHSQKAGPVPVRGGRLGHAEVAFGGRPLLAVRRIDAALVLKRVAALAGVERDAVMLDSVAGRALPRGGAGGQTGIGDADGAHRCIG